MQFEYSNRLEDSHLQNINIADARKLLFRYVDEVIFRNRKSRQLQWLLSDYKLVVGDYSLQVGSVKSGYLKQLLIAIGCMMSPEVEVLLTQLCTQLVSVASN